MYLCIDHLLTNKTKVGMSCSSRVGKAFRAVGLAALLVLVGCGGGGSGDPAAPTGAVVAIAPSLLSVELPVGAAGPLRATATLDDGTTVDITAKAEWRVSDGNVVVISDADGVKSLKGNAQGNVTLTIIYQGKEIVVPVKIGPHQLLGLAISGGPASTTLGSAAIQLKATATYSDGPVDVTTQTTWSSSDSAVAGVGASGPSAGLLDAKKIGKTKLTAKLDGSELEASFDFEVVASLLKNLTISGAVTPIVAGDTAQWTAVAHYEDGSEKPVTAGESWSSSAPDVATVDKGLVVAKKAGTTTITFVLGGATTAQSLMVLPPELRGLRIDVTTEKHLGAQYSVVIPRGLSTKVFPSGLMSDGSLATAISGVSWSSSDSAVIDVHSLPDFAVTHEITAHGDIDSTAVITASHDGVPSATVKISVGQPLPAVIKSLGPPEGITLSLGGGSLQLSALATFTDNTIADVTDLVDCLAGSGGVVTVDKCLVTAAKIGPATTVDATLKSHPQGAKAAVEVRVTEANTKLAPVGTVGQSGGVLATVPSDGSPAIFELSGATPGALYTLRIPGGANLRVAANSDMTVRLCEDNTPTVNGSLACAIQPNTAKVYFTVQGVSSGVSVPVDIAPGAAVDSGSFVVASKYSGNQRVAVPTQYQILGADNASYTVSVTNEASVSANWIVGVSSQRADGSMFCSNLAPDPKTTVACGIPKGDVASPASFGVETIYYLNATGRAEDVRVTITSGSFESQGTFTKPIQITAGKEFAGQVVANSTDAAQTPSVYELAVVQASYKLDFLLYDATSQVLIEVYLPNSQTSLRASSPDLKNPSTPSPTTVTLNGAPGSNGSPGYRIKVYAALTGLGLNPIVPSAETGGTAFKLIVTPH